MLKKPKQLYKSYYLTNSNLKRFSMHLFRYVVWVLMVFMVSGKAYSQEEQGRKKYTLTHEMSPEEAANFDQLYTLSIATDPPPGEVTQIAEYERMHGVLIGYPGAFGVPLDLIESIAEDVQVTLIVENNAQQNAVNIALLNQGVNMDHITYLITDLDSYWTRDYGPWYVRYGDHEIGVMDFIYNRPRPHDNAIPYQIAELSSLAYFGMDLITAGGNYMTDGLGISTATDLTWEENPSMSESEIEALLNAYCGIDEYWVVPDPTESYIKHIDTWAKFLDVDKILIREVPETHPNYEALEEAAWYYSQKTSKWGNPFQVYRIWTPQDEPYTNSLIVNDRVFVPITGSANDALALQTYQQAMPGYEVLGFNGSWLSTDALHCRTKGMADPSMFYIDHTPLLGVQTEAESYAIEAEMIAYSGANVNPDSIRVFYSINGGDVMSLPMTSNEESIYVASIPTPGVGSTVAYYIQGMDVEDNKAYHPFIGPYDPHVFSVGEPFLPEIQVSSSSVEIQLETNQQESVEFSISNIGQLPLSYSVELEIQQVDTHSTALTDSPNPNAWNSNTWTEEGWTSFDMNTPEGTVAEITVSMDYDVDIYVNESRVFMRSALGVESLIASGLSNGSYSISTHAFNGEPVNGEWRMWLEDTYGDGGHQARDIQINFLRNYEVGDWVSLDVLSGEIEPGEGNIIPLHFNSDQLAQGTYSGIMRIYSNDPETPILEVSLELVVEGITSIDEQESQNSKVEVYPNPSNTGFWFQYSAANAQKMILEVLSMDGKTVFSRQMQSDKTEGSYYWDGAYNSGVPVPGGSYLYRIHGEDFQATGIVIKH
jgi:agmatine deiminase